MKSLIASIVILGLVGMIIGVAVQGVEETVTATVCPKLISVTISSSTVDYGIQALGATDVIPTPASVTLTNNGNVDETFSVRGDSAVPQEGGTSWVLVSTISTGNQYIHRSSPDGTTFTALTLSNVAFAGTDTTKVTKGDCAGSGGVSKTLYLNMDTPTSSTTQSTFDARVGVLVTE